MHQVSKPRAANQSITEESGRPGTFRSKVGCEAIEEPCTKSTVPRLCAPAAGGVWPRNSPALFFPLLTQRAPPDSTAPPFHAARLPASPRGKHEIYDPPPARYGTPPAPG